MGRWGIATLHNSLGDKIDVLHTLVPPHRLICNKYMKNKAQIMYGLASQIWLVTYFITQNLVAFGLSIVFILLTLMVSKDLTNL